MNAIPGEAGIKNPMELVMEINAVLKKLDRELYSEYSNLKIK